MKDPRKIGESVSETRGWYVTLLMAYFSAHNCVGCWDFLVGGSLLFCATKLYLSVRSLN